MGATPSVDQLILVNPPSRRAYRNVTSAGHRRRVADSSQALSMSSRGRRSERVISNQRCVNKTQLLRLRFAPLVISAIAKLMRRNDYNRVTNWFAKNTRDRPAENGFQTCRLKVTERRLIRVRWNCINANSRYLHWPPVLLQQVCWKIFCELYFTQC